MVRLMSVKFAWYGCAELGKCGVWSVVGRFSVWGCLETSSIYMVIFTIDLGSLKFILVSLQTVL